MPKTLHLPAGIFEHCLPTMALPQKPDLTVGDALYWGENLSYALQQCNDKLDNIKKAIGTNE